MMIHQLDLVPSRWPKKPYCSNDKTARDIRPLMTALKRRYIQPNPPHLRVWSIYDIDREGAAYAWADANLPEPSWTAVNVENGHGHLVWGLSAPVLVDSPDMRQAPLRYLCAIESAFRARLGADQGYSGLMTKNPFHEHWRVFRGPSLYELGDLADWVELPKHLPKRKPEEIGLGRNVTVFEFLRHWAYRRIRDYKSQGLPGWNPWVAACNETALQRNGDFDIPMDRREVWHIVKSVSKWTWRRFEVKAKEDDQKWKAKQSYRGRIGGLAKGLANEGKRISARLMHAQGSSYQSIADSLGVSRRSVIYWCK